MLVSVGELRQALNGVTMTEGQKLTATLLLAGIQQELEVYLNRPVEPVLVTERTRVDPDGYCRLSVTPMLSVISTIRLSSGQPFLSYTIDPAQRPQYVIDTVPLSQNGQISSTMVPGGITASAGSSVEVTYIGGLDGNSIGIRGKILEIASRSWAQRNSDAVALRDGNAAPAEGFNGPLGWLPEEKLAFDRYRRRVVR